MGWDIELVRDNERVEVPPFWWGSNVLVGVIGTLTEDGEGLTDAGEYWLRNGDRLEQFREHFTDAEGEYPRMVPLGEFFPGDARTLAVTGQTRAHMSVTYNYRELFDFDRLDGLRGEESRKILLEGIQTGEGAGTDYWQCNQVNVLITCSYLLMWAVTYPDATWRVT